MCDYQTILVQVNNGVTAITLHRPERLNALTDEMLSEITQALINISKDDNVRTILLTGAGRGFCAGQDISSFGQVSDHHIYKHLMTYYRPIIKLLRTIEKPIIAAINGPAAGAGASLALACDLRIMATDAYLLQAFSNVALIPDAGSTWFMVRQVGYSRAFELAVEADRISAERCLELGLANRVVEPEALRPEAQSWAEQLAQRPTYTVGLTKRAMNYALTHSLLEAIEYEAHLQQLAAESQDFAEGTKAFLEKRLPIFKGR